MGRACSVQRRDDKFIKILVRKPEGKKSLERFRHKREDNIQTNLKEYGLDSCGSD
jgi:hypothetical protein